MDTDWQEVHAGQDRPVGEFLYTIFVQVAGKPSLFSGVL